MGLAVRDEAPRPDPLLEGEGTKGCMLLSCRRLTGVHHGGNAVRIDGSKVSC